MLSSPTMPNKSRADENGIKSARAKKSDKAKRSFELNGTYSSKHLRLREERALAEAARNRVGDPKAQ